jgi:hypothetical protein
MDLPDIVCLPAFVSWRYGDGNDFTRDEFSGALSGNPVGHDKIRIDADALFVHDDTAQGGDLSDDPCAGQTAFTLFLGSRKRLNRQKYAQNATKY